MFLIWGSEDPLTSFRPFRKHRFSSTILSILVHNYSTRKRYCLVFSRWSSHCYVHARRDLSLDDPIQDSKYPVDILKNKHVLQKAEEKLEKFAASIKNDVFI